MIVYIYCFGEAVVLKRFVFLYLVSCTAFLLAKIHACAVAWSFMRVKRAPQIMYSLVGGL